tara:strand:+ start:6821 stop:8047 length:1227 start_codon:yes stop_codon:yes gene_type:complete
MSGRFMSNKTRQPNKAWIFKKEWKALAYKDGRTPSNKTVVDFNFIERRHYGKIDHNNNSVIPNEDFITPYRDGFLFDFVADSLAAMQFNISAAIKKNLLPNDNVFGKMKILDSYKSPRLRYGEYLGNTLQYYNETHIPNNVGITSISSYKDYVKHFLNFFYKKNIRGPLTLTKFLTSNRSSPFDTGLCFKYYDIEIHEDRKKYDEIISHECFDHFQNICLNTGFSIVHNAPNMLMYNINSPANRNIKNSYGLYNLDFLFQNRFTNTYNIDISLLFSNINIYYNKYAAKNSLVKSVEMKCNNIESQFIRNTPVPNNYNPYTDEDMISMYVDIRNYEEEASFSENKLRNIKKKANYFHKSLDNTSSMSYINSIFRNQVWNRSDGFHDKKMKLYSKTNQAGGRPASRGTNY